MKLILLSAYDRARLKGDPAQPFAPVEVPEAEGRRLLEHQIARRPEEYAVHPVTGLPIETAETRKPKKP